MLSRKVEPPPVLVSPPTRTFLATSILVVVIQLSRFPEMQLPDPILFEHEQEEGSNLPEDTP